ncbi:hypothetical protein [Streptomyces sp. DSM 40907]|uniref:hypothetical protein n=1 Tax=Streptomyces kutzneri TaxID=3051179 RepID=UPI0028D3A78E|nr:hypothetical protein [Streptomyces sp. DSM 40907]
MDTVISFIRAEPEVATVMAALLAIAGGVAGSLLSGWVQARGGRAQASAAVEAARITAEAQHLASLHSDRRREIAAFIYEARHAANTANSLFYCRLDPSEIAALKATAQSAHAALRVKQAELELIAPVEVVEHASAVVEVVDECIMLADVRAAASQAFTALINDRANDPGSREAYVALVNLRAAYNGEGDTRALHTEAAAALRNVAALDEAQYQLLLDDAWLPALPPVRGDVMDRFSSALRRLVTSGRRVLRAEDGQAD